MVSASCSASEDKMSNAHVNPPPPLVPTHFTLLLFCIHSLKSMGGSITNADMLLSLAYKDFDNSFDAVQAAAPPASPSLLSRPSSWSRKILQLRQVPPQLEGIGVAHMGPALPPPIPVEEGEQEATRGVGGAAIPRTHERGGEGPAQIPPPNPWQVPPLENTRDFFRALITRRGKQGAAGRKTKRVSSIRREDFHRAFSRSDISSWRDRYRPTVARTIEQMEANRRQWRERERKVVMEDGEGGREGVGGCGGEVEQEVTKDGGEGRGNSIADTEEVSTVSTVGDDSGADCVHDDFVGMVVGGLCGSKDMDEAVSLHGTDSNAPC